MIFNDSLPLTLVGSGTSTQNYSNSYSNNSSESASDGDGSINVIIYGQQNNFSNVLPNSDSDSNSSSIQVFGVEVDVDIESSGKMTKESMSNFDQFFNNEKELPRMGIETDEGIARGISSSSSSSSISSSSSASSSSVDSDRGLIPFSNNQDKNALLMKKFQRFLQILKASGSGSGGEGHSDSNSQMEDQWTKAKLGLGLGSSSSDAMGAGTGIGVDNDMKDNLKFPLSSDHDHDFNLNLTLDGIADLNSLMGDYNYDSMTVKHILIILSYFVIACVAIIGNLLVVQLVIRSRRLHTLTHALLANLAVADLLMASLNIPFSAARVIMTEWPFGSFLCHVVPFVQVTSVYVTSITMAVIAIDRYQVIVNPLGRRMKNSQAIVLVILIWSLSAFLSLPYALYHKVVVMLTVRVVKRCQADFTPVARRWLTVATFLGQYFAPIFLTTTSYISIMLRLGLRSSVMGSTTPRQVAAQSKAKRTTIKMLVLTVIFFTVCWAPINAYHLLTHFNLVSHNSTAILICHIIAMSSTCYNPFIYCWLNEHFRREAIKWFCFFRRARSSRRSRSNSTVLELKSMGMICAHQNSPSSRNNCINNSGNNNGGCRGNGQCHGQAQGQRRGKERGLSQSHSHSHGKDPTSGNTSTNN